MAMLGPEMCPDEPLLLAIEVASVVSSHVLACPGYAREWVWAAPMQKLLQLFPAADPYVQSTLKFS